MRVSDGILAATLLCTLCCVTSVRAQSFAEDDEYGAPLGESSSTQRRYEEGPSSGARAPAAVARDEAGIAGRLRVGVDVSLLDYESISMTPSGGFGFSIDRSELRYGLSQSAPFGIRLGYALSEHLVLSGSVVLGSTVTTSGDSSVSQFQLKLLPSIDYVFGSARSTARLFLGAWAGVIAGKLPSAVSSVDELSFLIGAKAGCHVFAHERVSFDPALMIGYRAGSASTGDSAITDFSVRGFTFALLLGLSYWA